MLVEALASGEQILLLRKGGIADVGGEFRLEADSFVLWPTWLHQSPEWLRAEQQARVERADRSRPPEGRVPLTLHARVHSVHRVPSREHLDRLGDEHVWSPAYLDLRWRYRPELPLHLLVLATARLAAPVTVQETPAQRGCRSWVRLDEPIALDGATPVLEPADLTRRAERVRAALGS